MSVIRLLLVKHLKLYPYLPILITNLNQQELSTHKLLLIAIVHQLNLRERKSLIMTLIPIIILICKIALLVLISVQIIKQK